MSSLRFSPPVVVAGIAWCLLAPPGATAAADKPTSASSRPSSANAPSLNPMAAYPRAELKSFVNAPLFDPARRLPPPIVLPPVQPVAVRVEPPPALELVGVIGGAHAEAIVNQGGRTAVLHTGDHIGAWYAEVLPSTLRLHSGLRAYDYAMFQENGRTGALPVDASAAIVAERAWSGPSPLRKGE